MQKYRPERSTVGWLAIDGKVPWRAGRTLIAFQLMFASCIALTLMKGRTELRGYPVTSETYRFVHSTPVTSFRVEAVDRTGCIRTAFLKVLPSWSNSSWSPKVLTADFDHLLPAGDYFVNASQVGQNCFNSTDLYVDLEPDSLQNISCHDPVYNLNYSKMSILHKERAVQNKCSSAHAVLGPGFWNGSQWQPSDCQVEVRERGQSSFLFVHIAGDSVIRNMFEQLCLIIANSRGSRKVNREKDFRYCCGTNACLTFRFTWFPVLVVFPSWFKKKFQSREAFCKNDTICLQTIPQEMFRWSYSNIPFQNMKNTWHLSFFGSHSPELGPSEKTCQQLRHASTAKEDNILIFGTPAIRSEWIPEKYSTQKGYRTNARISALNEVLLDCVGPNSWVNLFYSTFARNTDEYRDAIHTNVNVSDDLALAIAKAFHVARETANTSPATGEEFENLRRYV